MNTVNILLQQLINALTYGSLIGFIAIGYTLVYGVLKLINFAHGNLVIFSIFLLLTFLTKWQIPLSLSFLFTIFGITLMAVLIYFIGYKPLRYSNKINLVGSALGMSMVVQNLIVLFWGTTPKTFPITLFANENIVIHSLIFNKLSILIIMMNIFILCLFYFIHHKTRFGIAVKALSVDYQTATLMGINVSKIIILIFIIGAILGSLGGLFIGLSYKSIDFTMGFDYGLKAFIASIIGGIGSISGAMLGGIIIGLIQTLSIGYLSNSYADVCTYSIIILLLIVKPNGLFGKVIEEKV